MMIFAMGNESAMERKVILPPDAFVQLLFQLRGGTFIDSKNCDLTALLQDVDFPAGTLGKKAKLESAQKGNVIVSRSIVTTTAATNDRCRILLSHRDAHDITTGPSILTSGNPRNTPESVLSRKVEIAPAPIDFERMGFALSSPDQTKGIHYLFDVFRARITDDARINMLKEHGTLVSTEEAMFALADKPLEKTILQKILENAA